MTIDENINNHHTLARASLIFITNVNMSSTDVWLPMAWVFVVCTSFMHHRRPHVKSLAIIDQIAVYHLVYQNGWHALMFCTWCVQAVFISTVTYSGVWYYAARLGKFDQDTRLCLHIIMYIMTCMSGHLIESCVVPSPMDAYTKNGLI